MHIQMLRDCSSAACGIFYLVVRANSFKFFSYGEQNIFRTRKMRITGLFLRWTKDYPHDENGIKLNQWRMMQ